MSLLLKQTSSVSQLALYDIVGTPGVAADLSHIDTQSKVQGYQGDEELDECLKGCDVVAIPAGVPRKPGLSLSPCLLLLPPIHLSLLLLPFFLSFPSLPHSSATLSLPHSFPPSLTPSLPLFLLYLKPPMVYTPSSHHFLSYYCL
jgi:hypothetical protein